MNLHETVWRKRFVRLPCDFHEIATEIGFHGTLMKRRVRVTDWAKARVRVRARVGFDHHGVIVRIS